MATRRSTDTQIESYQDILSTLGERQRLIFELIQFRPRTTAELTDILETTVNCVSGRITELRDAGLVEDSGQRRVNIRTGKKNIVWEVVE